MLFTPGQAVVCMAYSPSGQMLVSGSEDKTVRLWNPLTGRALAEFKGPYGSIKHVEFSPDSALVRLGYRRTCHSDYDIIIVVVIVIIEATAEVICFIVMHILRISSLGFCRRRGILAGHGTVCMEFLAWHGTLCGCCIGPIKHVAFMPNPALLHGIALPL